MNYQDNNKFAIFNITFCQINFYSLSGLKFFLRRIVKKRKSKTNVFLDSLILLTPADSVETYT